MVCRPCTLVLLAGLDVFLSFRLMSHDPTVYKNPMEFDPARFMGPNPEQDVREYCFGFGRRYVGFAALPLVHTNDSFYSEHAQASGLLMRQYGSPVSESLRCSISRLLLALTGSPGCQKSTLRLAL